jgi:hypothetical protein
MVYHILYINSLSPWMIGRSACVFYGRTGPAYNWPPASIFYATTGPDGRTDRRTGFLQEGGEVGASPSSGFLLCALFRGPETQIPTVRLSRSGNPRSWNPRSVYRGPETQCPFLEVLKLRSWEPDTGGLCPTVTGTHYFYGQISVCPSVEVLKPRSQLSVYRGPETQCPLSRSWNSGPESQARADCVRPSRVPTSIM